MELGAIPKRKVQAGKLLTEVEDVQMSDGDNETMLTSIESLPDEVLEHILSLLSPYSDLESCALTCSRFCLTLTICYYKEVTLNHFHAGFLIILFVALTNYIKS